MTRELLKENCLWEFLVNDYTKKQLLSTLKSMNYHEVTNFLTDCDKLASDIFHDKNTMFDKKAVNVIIQIRKIAEKLGRKKIMEAMK